MLYPIVNQPDLRKSLKHLKPAGVIAYAFTREIADALRGISGPIINVSRADPTLPFPQVNIEELRIGAMAAEHLMECGLRHFGYFGPSRYGPETGREGGFYQALQKFPHTISTCHTEASHFDPSDTGSVSIEQSRLWIRNLPKPAGVFTPNDMWGLLLSDICRQEGIRVPEEVAIIGVDDDELLCELAQPSLSSVAIPAERVGYEAAAQLDRLMNGSEAPVEPILLDPVGVIIRQSSDTLAVEDPDLAAAIQFIREHAYSIDPISINDIVQSVAISRRSLERKFRMVLGHSPSEEIQRLRVRRAMTLLESTDLQMPQIAMRSGFTSAKQLSTVFHQVTGITPSAHRRKVEVSEKQKPAPTKRPTSSRTRGQ